MHRIEQSFLEDRRSRALRHSGIRGAPAPPRIRRGNGRLRVAQALLGVYQTTLQ